MTRASPVSCRSSVGVLILSQYVIGDYWLFALEVPPTGYEWVRDGSDALLIDTNSGEILQVEYGVFA